MIHTLSIWLSYQVAGVPVGAWLALAALAEVQDRIRSSRWKSNTILQALLNGTVGRLLARYPSAAPEPVAPILPPTNRGSASLVVVMLLAALGFAAVLALAGCHATADDLRRACAAEGSVLAGGYRVGAAGYRARVAAAKESTDVAAARERLSADTLTYDKFSSVLDAAAAEAESTCAAADAVEAGQRRDVPALIAAMAAAGTRVAEAVASIEAAFGGGGAK